MTITVDATPERIRVTAPSRLADLVSAIPGIRALPREDNAWEGPTTAAAMLAIARDLGPRQGFTPTTGATALIEHVHKLCREVEAVKLGAQLGGHYDDRLWEYQPAGVWMMVERKRALIGDDMGTGKTVMALTAARQVSSRLTLVVAPNSMKHRWAREVETWYPEARGFVMDGTAKHKQKTMEEVYAIRDGVDDFPIVVAVNWESLATLSRITGYGSIKLTEKDAAHGPLNLVGWDCVIADEAHRGKDPKSKQTRALWFLAKDATYRWGLTGTPVLNTPSDLWAIGRFYDPDTYGPSSHKWHARYVDWLDNYHGPVDTGLREDRLDEFTAWFDLGFIRRTKDEAGLGLPEITYQTRELDMTPKQKSAYNKMVTDNIALIDDEFLVANNPLTLLARLSQIASATPVIDNMDVVALDTPSNKVSALMDFITYELPEGKQLVIFSPSEKLITLAVGEMERKGHHVARITGKESSKVRDITVQRFQEGEVRFVACTLGAANEGIDLFAADTTVFLGRSYKYGESGRGQQAESRTHRAGQQSDKVTVIDFISKGTVDEEVVLALQSKGEMAEEVLRDRARQLLKEKL